MSAFAFQGTNAHVMLRPVGMAGMAASKAHAASLPAARPMAQRFWPHPAPHPMARVARIGAGKKRLFTQHYQKTSANRIEAGTGGVNSQVAGQTPESESEFSGRADANCSRYMRIQSITHCACASTCIKVRMTRVLAHGSQSDDQGGQPNDCNSACSHVWSSVYLCAV